MNSGKSTGLRGDLRAAASHPPAPDTHGSYEALLRAAERAREVARQTGTCLIRVENGRVVRVDPAAGGVQ